MNKKIILNKCTLLYFCYACCKLLDSMTDRKNDYMAKKMLLFLRKISRFFQLIVLNFLNMNAYNSFVNMILVVKTTLYDCALKSDYYHVFINSLSCLSVREEFCN